MATFARHVDVDWTGGLMDGSGTAKAGTGAFTLPVTFPEPDRRGRWQDDARGAAWPARTRVCYAMVLTNTIGKQGGKAKKVRVTCTVTADKSDAGIKVVSSQLKAVVEGLEGIEKSKLQELATGAEKGCPISNAIRGSVNITVDAQAV